MAETVRKLAQALRVAPRVFVDDDELAAVGLTTAATAARLGVPGIALALEGGYDLDALRRSTAATVRGLRHGRRSAHEVAR
jgi:acetoin utilization deacetylase AcuC-like enzyme